MLDQCCKCKRVRCRKGYRKIEPCDEPAIAAHDVSHGYCPRCARRFKREGARSVRRRDGRVEQAAAQ